MRTPIAVQNTDAGISESKVSEFAWSIKMLGELGYSLSNVKDRALRELHKRGVMLDI